jgi:ATP-dependent DNA helicase RecQ
VNKYQQILTKYWGYSNFRPLQEDIIKSVADEGKDTLGLLPTGGGKSIIFQVPALSKPGICLVVTPLIALMKDQVENLAKREIKAAAIYTGMTKHEIELTLENCIFGGYKFLYLSPERLGTELFLAKLQSMNVNLIAIDEAHCISQWGYDFRPSYLQIANIRKHLPDIPILALTATATEEVVEDIQEKLLFRQKNAFRKSFERKNLIYIVRTVEDKLRYLLKIALTNKGSGIVYVRNRKKTKEIALFLIQNKISADYYHAGINTEEKDLKQERWKKGQTRIIVSTNAFGMGIDKSNVRFVVHMDLPDSLEAYFQEAGRGGRDELIAYSVILYNDNDKLKLEKSIEDTFPEKEKIKSIYNALGNFFQLPIGSGKGQTFDFNIGEFASKYTIPIITIYNSLKFLQKEGYIEYTEEVFNPSKIFFNINRDDLYKFQVANAQFDAFIKLVLRTYTGLFSQYVSIDEKYLAKKTNSTVDVVYKYLQNLAKNKVINYVPQRKTPYIIFTEERLDEKNLRIEKDNYEVIKKRYITRIDAVLNYATSTAKCRSQILLQYFGEIETDRCGNCDICRKRNELELSKYEFDLILDKVKNLLRGKSFKVEDIISITNEKEEKVLKVIQWLIDNNKIKNNEKMELTWHKL